jgi:hypothetical protein
MTYDDLLNKGSIRPSRPTRREIAGMLGTGHVRIRHIRASSPEPDVCYELAYDVARAAAQAVMATEGYRPAGASHHEAIFEFLRRVEDGRWACEAEFFDQARSTRRLCVYDQNGAISAAEADGLLSVAVRFFEEVNEWIGERSSDSRPSSDESSR